MFGINIFILYYFEYLCKILFGSCWILFIVFINVICVDLCDLLFLKNGFIVFLVFLELLV